MEVEDEVRLVIPAEPGFLRLARLTAAAVASRMGFNFDEVDDLRIAVDELCYFLLAGRRGPGTIALTCAIHDDVLTVTGVGNWPDADPGAAASPPLTELSSRILEAIVDDYECDGTADGPHFSLVKRRT